jgi:TolB-like protein/class 3 adenylate cyclase/tetratricopeptide (TPR) repeat protein
VGETRKLAAILVADVVGYSRLMGEDEAGTALSVRKHREAARPIVASHGGRIVKTTGDGLLLEFPSVVAAVGCAIAIQKLMVERNAETPEAKRIVYRIGVNLGDVLIEGDDILGEGVNIASRLEGVCEPGGVAISGAAHDHVRGRIDADFVDLGEKLLKNIARPVRVFAANVGPSGLACALSPPSGSLTGEAPRASIAVLPFANMSDDPEQGYFADGIAEDIITALSKVSQLFVIARNSSFTFKGRNVDVREVSKNLGVRYVLEGSVRKSGNRVRATAQLVDAKTGGHLWAERFDRDLTDIFAVQDDVTKQIVAALALNLREDDRLRLMTEHTDNLEAYDLFLRGRELYYLQSKESNSQARELFQRAAELDPRFVPAVFFVSATHILDYMNGWSASPSQSLEEARRTARLALALDDRYPPAHLALGSYNLMSRQHDAAIREIETAISLDPNYAQAHNELGLILHYAGRSDEALPHFDRAMALNPYFPGHWLHFPALATYQLGRYETAVAILKRRILRNPDTDASRVLLAASYGQLGLIDEARSTWREVFRVSPNYSLEHRREVLPYKNPEDFERIVEGLRKAGLPEP